MKIFRQIAIVASFSALLITQTTSGQSHFPFGMYTYTRIGLEPDGKTVSKSRDGKYANFLEFWRQNLCMNSFVMSFQDAAEYKIFYSSEFSNSGLKNLRTPIFSMFGPVSTLCSSTYLDFSLKNATLNIINFSSDHFKLIPDANGWRVLSNTDQSPGKSTGGAAGSSSDITFFKPLVTSLKLTGGHDLNWLDNDNVYSIRPETGNTVTYQKKGTASDTTITEANFWIRLSFKNCNTSSKSGIRIHLRNGVPNSDKNDAPINGTIINFGNLSPAQQHTDTNFIIPFKLRISETFRSSKTHEMETKGYAGANFFFMKFVMDCHLEPGESFTLTGITLYDSLGIGICENTTEFVSNSTVQVKGSSINLRQYLQEISDIPVEDSLIVHLADESVIGNFRPSHVVAAYLDSIGSNKNIKFVSTCPNFDGHNGTDKIANVTRYISEVSGSKRNWPDYLMPDDYPFDYGDSREKFETYKSNIYDVLYTRYNQVVKAITQNGFKTTVLGVLQLHSWDQALREPTQEEMIAESYVSMLVGFKGIQYWWSGLAETEERQCLYKFGRNLTNSYYLDMANMWGFKRDAIIKLGNFLNFKIGTNKSIGDLLLQADVKGSQIAGFENNLKNSNFKDVNLGEGESSLTLRSIGIVDRTSLELLPAESRNIAGINAFQIPGIKNKKYYLVVNLNQDGHEETVQCRFASTNNFSGLKISTLNSSELKGKQIGKNGLVQFILPFEGAIVLEVTGSF